MVIVDYRDGQNLKMVWVIKFEKIIIVVMIKYISIYIGNWFNGKLIYNNNYKLI